jgi:multiple sugar transport system substrate-binding protein
MRRSGMVMGIVAFALVVSACTASGGGGSSVAPSAVNTASGASHAPVTLDVWSFYNGREFDQYAEVLKDFTDKYPWITIVHTPGKKDPEILRGINSGTAPDLAISEGPDNVAKFCDSGAYQDLTPFLTQDGMDITKIIPEPALRYSSYQGNQCTLPVLSDAYGLYYNKDMFAAANISKPPKTFSELQADAKALTQFNPDGSIKVAGFIPLGGFYENDALYNGLYSGGTWYDAGQKSAFASDPTWAGLLTWQKDMIESIYGPDGYQKLTDFVSLMGGPSSEWNSAQGFEAGKVAMTIDGEWRTAFIKGDGSDVNYGTAPFPVADDTPQLYGAGQIGGDTFGMPTAAAHPAEAWLLLKYLATDTGAQEKLAETLGNVPTTFAALKDPKLKKLPNFKVFLDIFANPQSAFKPLTVIGETDAKLWENFITDWQAGDVPDLQQGLENVANQIDQQFQLG